MSDPRLIIEILRRTETQLQSIAPNIEGTIQQAALETRQAEDALDRSQMELEHELKQAEYALAACMSSRDDDGNSYDCSTYAQHVYTLRSRLEDLHRVRAAFERAVSQFQGQASRIQSVLDRDISAASYWLRDRELALTRFEGAASLPGTSATGKQAEATGSSQRSTSSMGTAQGVSWGEKRDILKRIDSGLAITLDDLHKLQQPTTDLQTGTLEEDRGWVQQLLESERHRGAMRDSQEAQDLSDAILATLKAIQYNRSKS